MAFQNPFSGEGTTTPTTEAPAPAPAAPPPAPAAGSGGFVNPFAGTPTDTSATAPAPSGGGGILASALHAASPFLHALGAPSQVVEHTGHAIGSLLQGDTSGAAESLKNAALQAGTLGQMGKQTSFTEAIGAKKLPFGLETAGTIATDPLTFLTAGLGPEARAAMETVKGLEGGADVAKAIRAGGLGAVDDATKQTIRDALVANAKDVAPAKAASVADKQMTALAARGQGGIGLHVPGTNLDKHLFAGFDRPEVAQAIGDRFPRLAGMVSPDREARQFAAEEARAAAAGEAARVGRNAIHAGSLADAKQGIDKVTNAVRGQLLAFPGTVVNRVRRNAMVNMFDGISPAEQVKLLGEARQMRNVGGSVESKLGIDSLKMDGQIEKTIAKSENAAKAWDASRAAGHPALDPITGSDIPRPQIHDYASAMDEVLGKQGLSRDALKATLDKAGIDGQRYLNLREILAGAGENLYRTGGKGQDLIKAGDTGLRGGYTKLRGAVRAGYSSKIREGAGQAEALTKSVNALHNLERFGNVKQATEHVANVMGDPWRTTSAEKWIGPISPFWGAIRTHIASVARTGFDNPARVSMLEHLLSNPNNPLSQGSGNPIEASAKVLDVPAHLAAGVAGAAGSAVGHPFAQGELVTGFKGLGGLTAGAVPAAGRLAYSPELLGKAPGKALSNAAKTALPSYQRLPIPGKKTNLKQQIARFLSGLTLGG